jgi:osmoprotectant transport system ATP-binding protein
MIELRDVTKRYEKNIAVSNLFLSVNEGEVCTLIGPSGCGKSTTIKLINRMLEPENGEIRVQGKNVRDFKPEVLRRQIGYVIQYVGLFPHMSVAENIGIVPRMLGWGKAVISSRVDELLSLVDLDPLQYRSTYPHELSGGEAQRIGVARALAADPPVLLMDEPFGAVDPLTREVLQAEFIKIQKTLRKTVVFVTHDIDEAVRIADRIALMRGGSIVQHDTPENMLAHPLNKFVHDFVGTDRALKRLSRFTVGKIMRKENSIVLTGSKSADFEKFRAKRSLRFLWVLDKNRRLLGWVDTREGGENATLEEVMTDVHPSQFGVREDATLKEALSRMLGEGVKAIPVLDYESRVVGEIGLKDIEKVTEETERQWKE